MVGEGVSDSVVMCEWCVVGVRTAEMVAWRAKGGLMWFVGSVTCLASVLALTLCGSAGVRA